MRQPTVYLLLLGAGLLACSGNSSENKEQTNETSTTTDVPTAFAGSWVNDVPARTPPDPEPDHYDRTEYEIVIANNQATLTKWAAALDIKTRKEWFRNKINGPLTCTYIADRKCLICGMPSQSVKDSLFIVDEKLENRSPLASNRSAAGRGPLVLTRKPL
ncbi:hypothetical protein [Spirosoma sordidisoli]|uniref:Uncharacterized protein n=1 Tax=Spirosoma sordidisoli TaxID=2502893 RepID=A0A4Q2UE18_9BACT|nr:hypothetical protein [Spirosoma sordidisoli]RYC66502.1 hypothetical protein EQG79_29465 [Spirosoma sordidisoli]